MPCVTSWVYSASDFAGALELEGDEEHPTTTNATTNARSFIRYEVTNFIFNNKLPLNRDLLFAYRNLYSAALLCSGKRSASCLRSVTAVCRMCALTSSFARAASRSSAAATIRRCSFGMSRSGSRTSRAMKR